MGSSCNAVNTRQFWLELMTYRKGRLVSHGCVQSITNGHVNGDLKQIVFQDDETVAKICQHDH